MHPRDQLQYSVCVDMLYTHLPMEQRIERAAESGAAAIECWGWCGKDLRAMSRQAQDLGMAFSVLCLDCQDDALRPAVPALLSDGRFEDLRRVIRDSAEVMHAIGIKRAILTAGQSRTDLSREQQLIQLIEGLQAAADEAQRNDILLLLEPLNQHDHPGAFLSHSETTFALAQRVDSPHLRVLYDIYHQQITEGNLIPTIRENIEWIGHFHMADTPGRHEPGTGEINYDNVLDAIAALPYEGFVGLEYQPTDLDMPALQFLRR